MTSQEAEIQEMQGLLAGLQSNSALRTFTLRREPLSSHWLLESIDDDC